LLAYQQTADTAKAGIMRTANSPGNLMEYQTLKHLHMSFAAASGGLFLLRAGWRWFSPELLQARWVRILPHVIDTLLLTSALALAIWSRQSPTQQPWLAAKLCALLLYIGFGTIAIKRGKTPAQRGAALIAALLCFAYIVMVAVHKQPWW
jgi:uncharacterized membrane protein SirB2